MYGLITPFLCIYNSLHNTLHLVALTAKNPLTSVGDTRAIHCSVLAWIIPWTEEPGRLQSIGSQRVEHDLMTKLNQNQILLHENKVGGLTIRFFLKQFLLSLNVVFVFDPSH